MHMPLAKIGFFGREQYSEHCSYRLLICPLKGIERSVRIESRRTSAVEFPISLIIQNAKVLKSDQTLSSEALNRASF